MRLKRSNKVDEQLNRFYAVLATAAAQRALTKMVNHADDADAEAWAKIAEKWLHRAGARAAYCYFNQPKT